MRQLRTLLAARASFRASQHDSMFFNKKKTSRDQTTTSTRKKAPSLSRFGALQSESAPRSRRSLPLSTGKLRHLPLPQPSASRAAACQSSRCVWQLENGREERMFKRLSDEYIYFQRNPNIFACACELLFSCSYPRSSPKWSHTTISPAHHRWEGAGAVQGYSSNTNIGSMFRLISARNTALKIAGVSATHSKSHPLTLRPHCNPNDALMSGRTACEPPKTGNESHLPS